MNDISAKCGRHSGFLNKYREELESIGLLSRLILVGAAITALVHFLKPNYFGYPFFKGFSFWDLLRFWPLLALFVGLLALKGENQKKALNNRFLPTVLFSSVETILEEFGLRLVFVIPIMASISMANWFWMNGGALLLAFVLAAQFPSIISGAFKSENLKEFGKYFLVFLICAVGAFVSVDSYWKQSGPIIELGNWLAKQADLQGVGDHVALFIFTLYVVSYFLMDEGKYSGKSALLNKVVMVLTLTETFFAYGFFFALTLRLLCNFEYYALRFIMKR